MCVLRSLLPKPKYSSSGGGRTDEPAEQSSAPNAADQLTNEPLVRHPERTAEGADAEGRSTARIVQSMALTIPKQTDAEGGTRYDLIARVGHGPDRQVQTSLRDTQPARNVDPASLARPTPDQVAAETAEARAALQALVQARTAKVQPKNFSATRADQIVRFTPRGAPASAAKTIRLVEAPVDPLEPARFKHKRIPRAPPSPPAPRLHSPPRKITAEEQRAWHIPPCVSSWKNPKGYTVPLDKRLAADGRALQEGVLNGRVSDLAEALFMAERASREEVELRAAVHKKVVEADQRQRDEQLRALAEKARLEAKQRAAEVRHAAREEERYLRASGQHDLDAGHLGITIQERERIRREAAYERERELRLSRMSVEQRARILDREASRDISERIALGQVAPGALAPEGAGSGLFDERLFDRSAGVAAGHGGGEDDIYNLYDKPLFASSALHMIYRPHLTAEGAEEEAAGSTQGRLGRPDRALAGVDLKQQVQEGPVQFEKDLPPRGGARAPAVEADPFGVDQFLSQAKQGKRPADSAPSGPSEKHSRQ